jgi:hypothetical protein
LLMTPRRRRRVALIVAAVMFATIALLLAWFWIGSSGAVRQARALEDRAIRVVEDLRIPELRAGRGPSRMMEKEIRLAWALSKTGDPEPLTMLLVGDLYWRPGRGIWVESLFRSDLEMRGACLRLADTIGHPASRCPAREDWDEYWLPVEREGVSGAVYVHEQLRSPLGTKREYVTIVTFELKACGTVREPGSGPCP